ncbi:MAG TPA: hypothetical protein VF268_14720 [Gammaproteobacteria bacterium]
MKRQMSLVVVFFCSVMPVSVLADAGFRPGNILVSTNDTVYEYTTDGELVTQIPIPASPENEMPRDLTVLQDGRLAVFNGTFSPVLSVFDGSVWTDLSIDGWSTPNNITYGGITSIGDTVFVTDGYTAGGEAKGLIAVDLAGGTHERFIDANDYIDLTLGKDGLLYALRNVYGALDVVDPATYSVIRSVSLGHTSSSRSAIANADGIIYMVSLSGYIGQYDSNGTLLNTLSIRSYIHDIDIDNDGRIIVGSNSGEVYLTDENLSSFSEIPVSTSDTFVSFVTPVTFPEDPAPPVLSGSHKRRGRDIQTTLIWSTDASGVDVYFNGQLVETVTERNTATYSYFKKLSQVFVVCNAGTLDCSNQYVAN